MAISPASSRSRLRTLVIIALGALCTAGGGFVLYQIAGRAPTAVPSPTRSVPASADPEPTLVRFTVRPPDALVEIGGKEVSRQSPFEIQLDRGVYSVAVSRPGYKRWIGQITLQDRESQTINVALEPAAAIVRVSSQPIGLVAELIDHR